MIQKDFKIGLVVGAICLLGLLAWLATNKSLSTDARLTRSFEQSKSKAPPVPPVNAPPMTPVQTAPPEIPPEETDTPPQPIVAQAEPPVTVAPAFVGVGPNLNAPEDPATEPTGPKIKTNRFHIVRKGETLSEISQAVYGTAKLWPKIFNANRDRLDAPEKIQPRMYLIIPD
ncbi:MAG: LysM peptidoglycan-binding domain-containing protein [Phycisphaerae bacterium]|nr:LysM peptidoglycan-binding domain-containing protein [Phycisphaerae bacterium]